MQVKTGIIGSEKGGNEKKELVKTVNAFVLRTREKMANHLDDKSFGSGTEKYAHRAMGSIVCIKDLLETSLDDIVDHLIGDDIEDAPLNKTDQNTKRANENDFSDHGL